MEHLLKALEPDMKNAAAWDPVAALTEMPDFDVVAAPAVVRTMPALATLEAKDTPDAVAAVNALLYDPVAASAVARTVPASATLEAKDTPDAVAAVNALLYDPVAASAVARTVPALATPQATDAGDAVAAVNALLYDPVAASAVARPMPGLTAAQVSDAARNAFQHDPGAAPTIPTSTAPQASEVLLAESTVHALDVALALNQTLMLVTELYPHLSAPAATSASSTVLAPRPMYPPTGQATTSNPKPPSSNFTWASSSSAFSSYDEYLRTSEVDETHPDGTLVFSVDTRKGRRSLELYVERLKNVSSCKRSRTKETIVVLGADELHPCKKRAKSEGPSADLARLTGTIRAEKIEEMQSKKQIKVLDKEFPGAVARGGNASNNVRSKNCGNLSRSKEAEESLTPMYVPFDPSTGLLQYDYTEKNIRYVKAIAAWVKKHVPADNIITDGPKNRYMPFAGFTLVSIEQRNEFYDFIAGLFVVRAQNKKHEATMADPSLLLKRQRQGVCALLSEIGLTRPGKRIFTAMGSWYDTYLFNVEQHNQQGWRRVESRNGRRPNIIAYVTT